MLETKKLCKILLACRALLSGRSVSYLTRQLDLLLKKFESVVR